MNDRIGEAHGDLALDLPATTTTDPASTPREPWQVRLGFLSADITRLQRLLLQRASERIGGTHVQWRLLRELALRQGSTQSQLGEILDVNKATMCGLINRMMRAGLIERRSFSGDQRVKRLYLTQHAKQAMAHMRAEVDLLTAETMGQIPDEVGESVVQCLESIKANLLQAKDAPSHKPPRKARAQRNDEQV